MGLFDLSISVRPSFLSQTPWLVATELDAIM